MQAKSIMQRKANRSSAFAAAPCHVQAVQVPRSRPVVRSADADASPAAVTYSFSDTSSSSNGTATNTASSVTTTPSSSASTSTSSTVTATKLALLELLAALDRGTLASHADKEAVERLVRSLEQSGSGSDPFSGTPAAIEGRWELLYTNTEVFRASPFFLAFQNGLVQNKELAEAIFKFTDAIPGAEIGSAQQTVSLLSGNLISEVNMSVFPGLTGTVVTSSRVQVQGPRQLGLTIESTRVTGSSFSPFLDTVAVPVEQLISQVRGEGATNAVYEITYVDANLRITRAGDQLMLHRRVL